MYFPVNYQWRMCLIMVPYDLANTYLPFHVRSVTLLLNLLQLAKGYSSQRFQLSPWGRGGDRMSPNPFSMATEVSPSLLPAAVQAHKVHKMMKLSRLYW